MELLTEPQRPALWVSVLLTVVLMAGSDLLVWALQPPQATANRMFWYMTRAAGFTAYELLALTVLVGLSTSSGLWDRLRLRRWVTQFHQFAALLTVPFLALHLWGLHEDTTVPFSWTRLLVPFTSTYRPLATGLGVISLYAVLAIIASSWLRPRIRTGWWKAIHGIAFPAFAAVTLHGLTSGTDSLAPWARWLYIVPSSLFVLLMLRRLARR